MCLGFCAFSSGLGLGASSGVGFGSLSRVSRSLWGLQSLSSFGHSLA